MHAYFGSLACAIISVLQQCSLVVCWSQIGLTLLVLCCLVPWRLPKTKPLFATLLLLEKRTLYFFYFVLSSYYLWVHLSYLNFLQSLRSMRCWIESPLDLKKHMHYQRYQSKFTWFIICWCTFQNYPSLDVYPLQLIKSIEVQGTDKFRRIVLDAPSTVCPVHTTISIRLYILSFCLIHWQLFVYKFITQGHTLKLLSANNWIEKMQDMLIKVSFNVASDFICYNWMLLLWNSYMSVCL